MEPARGSLTFIVRISPSRDGRLTGVVERVRTGEKHRFEGLDGLGAVLARAVATAADSGATGSTPGPSFGSPPGAVPEACRPGPRPTERGSPRCRPQGVASPGGSTRPQCPEWPTAHRILVLARQLSNVV